LNYGEYWIDSLLIQFGPPFSDTGKGAELLSRPLRLLSALDKVHAFLIMPRFSVPQI
jgi:hypothetical protein